MAKETSKTPDGLLHAQGGAHADEKVVIEGMKAFEQQLERESAHENEALEEDDFLEQTLQRLLESSGAEVKSLFEKQEKLAHANFEEAIKAGKSLTAPTPMAVEPGVFVGSYGITSTPPYPYVWTHEKGEGGGYTEAYAQRNSGALGTRAIARFSASRRWGASAIATYVRPNVKYGYMEVTAAPSLASTVMVQRWLRTAHAVTKIQLLVGKYRLNGTFVNFVGESSHTIHDRTGSGGVSSKSYSMESSGYSLSTSAYVDDAHFYVPWVVIRAYARSTGGGTFSLSQAQAAIEGVVPWIRITIF